MAAYHVSPDQLRMLMTAQELHDTHSIDVAQTPESRFGRTDRTMSDMWAVKRKENRRSGLDKDVAAHGVKEPVQLASGRDVTGSVIRNGHHRIQAAYEANPRQLLPVEHSKIDW